MTPRRANASRIQDSLARGIVVTGTEVLTGRIADRNGPWISEAAGRAGRRGRPHPRRRRPARGPRGGTALHGRRGDGPDRHLGRARSDRRRPDRRDRRPLRRRRAVSSTRRWRRRSPRSCATSPAASASTRRRCGRRTASRRWSPRARCRSTRSAPRRAWSCRPTERVVIVLPGPPRELRPMWPRAVESRPVQAVLARATPLLAYTVRMFGIPESEIAKSLREIEAGGVELGDGRDHDLPAPRRDRDRRALPGRGGAGRRGGARRARRPPRAPPLQPRRRDDRLAAGAAAAGPQAGLAESCSGGLLAARITDLPGASAYFAGGVVAYSNEAKAELLGVDPALIERARGGLGRGRRGDVARRPGALRRRRRRLDHRHRRPRRGHARRSRSATSASTPASPTARASPATRSSPAAARTSASAPPWSPCTCCGPCSATTTRLCSEAGTHIFTIRARISCVASRLGSAAWRRRG